MKRIKIFTCTRSVLQQKIDDWIDGEKPDIISVSAAVEDNYPITYIIYDDAKKVTEEDLLKS